MEKSLTILYTNHIRGDLDMLPRLYTLIRKLKAQPIDDEDEVMLCAIEPLSRRTLLLDLGDSCAPEVWHCAATGGRSTLLVLDAMGYDAANVGSILTAESRAKLDANLIRMALVDDAHPYETASILMDAGTPTTRPHDLHISLSPHDSTRLDGRTLHLEKVGAGQVGMAQVGRKPGNGGLTLAAHEIFTLPPGTPPDPTIAATVEYVIGEARFYQRRQNE